jgi:hypothetical protein
LGNKGATIVLIPRIRTAAEPRSNLPISIREPNGDDPMYPGPWVRGSKISAGTSLHREKAGTEILTGGPLWRLVSNRIFVVVGSRVLWCAPQEPPKAEERPWQLGSNLTWFPDNTDRDRLPDPASGAQGGTHESTHYICAGWLDDRGFNGVGRRGHPGAAH